MPKNSASSKRDLLSAHPIFLELDRDELDVLVRHTRIEKFSANQILSRKGDPGDYMMAVTKGRVKISTVALDGKPMLLNIIGPGDIFG